MKRGVKIVLTLSAVLLIEGLPGDSEVAWIWQEVSIAGGWLIPTIGLPAVLLATFRYCRNWFSAARATFFGVLSQRTTNRVLSTTEPITRASATAMTGGVSNSTKS